jgi:hypothetical protein
MTVKALIKKVFFSLSFAVYRYPTLQIGGIGDGIRTYCHIQKS